MADNKAQSFENHAQIVPMFHYVTLGILQYAYKPVTSNAGDVPRHASNPYPMPPRSRIAPINV